MGKLRPRAGVWFSKVTQKTRQSLNGHIRPHLDPDSCQDSVLTQYLHVPRSSSPSSKEVCVIIPRDKDAQVQSG